MSYLIDTNIISELRKGERANEGVRTWFSKLEPEEVFLSVLTVGEVRKGIELVRHRGDAVAAASLDRWLKTLAEVYAARIVPIDWEIAIIWGRLNVPDPIPVVDGLLAATALAHGLIVATRNLADIERTGVVCLNPFS